MKNVVEFGIGLSEITAGGVTWSLAGYYAIADCIKMVSERAVDPMIVPIFGLLLVGLITSTAGFWKVVTSGTKILSQ